MQLSQQQPSRMQNPCTNDQVRLNCGPDAACLKAHLSQLSPSCTMFLKGPQEARPSPSPAPMGASTRRLSWARTARCTLR